MLCRLIGRVRWSLVCVVRLIPQHRSHIRVVVEKVKSKRAGQEFFTGFIRYGDDFRTLRRYTSQNFNSRDHLSLYPYIQEQVKILLRNLLVDKGDFEPHLNR